jgi:hypothetical protein
MVAPLQKRRSFAAKFRIERRAEPLSECHTSACAVWIDSLTFRALTPQAGQSALQELPGLFRIVIPAAVCHYISRGSRSHRQA